jgi:hypothetical protein
MAIIETDYSIIGTYDPNISLLAAFYCWKKGFVSSQTYPKLPSNGAVFVSNVLPSACESEV